MSPKLGITVMVACCGIALFNSSCSNYAAPRPVPSPTPASSAGPDRVYVQDTGSKTIRVYKGGSTNNGLVVPIASLPTSDGSQPDVVYSPTFDVLWFPSAYPLQTFSGPLPTPIRVWTATTTKNNVNPDQLVPFIDGAGAAVYDSVNDLLYVATIDGPTLAIYSSAHLMTSTSTPAAIITLVITDGSILGPRPIEMVLDTATGRLFASDLGAVVATFDNFAATAAAAAASHTNVTVPANREIAGLNQPDGMAYSPANDILYIGEHNFRQIDVIHGASTFNGPAGHSQVITGFGSGPSGIAFDAARDLLFVYDPNNGAGGGIDVLPAPEVATGNVNNIPNKRAFFDNQVPLSGFGVAVDTTR